LSTTKPQEEIMATPKKTAAKSATRPSSASADETSVTETTPEPLTPSAEYRRKAAERERVEAERQENLEPPPANETVRDEATPLSAHGESANLLADAVDRPADPNVETKGKRQAVNDQVLGAGGGIPAGTSVSYKYKDTSYPARVITYHPAIPDNEDIGLKGRGAQVDLHVYTGDPATDGRIRVEGVPVSEVGLG
jgi:hypothetical protein